MQIVQQDPIADWINSLKGGIKMTVQSAYIHIPFCVRICTYCDFNKYFIQNQPVDEYLDALITEMSTTKYRNLKTMYVVAAPSLALSINPVGKIT